MKIFYFTADWCQPCLKTKPLVLSLNNNNIFDIIDVEQYQELASEFSVKTIPTFIGLNREGAEVFRKTGPQTLDSLKAMIDRVNI